MKRMLDTLQQGLSELLFPRVCLGCGQHLPVTEFAVCSLCLKERLEEANPDGLAASSDSLLPEGIILQHACWHFDKGGLLQDLLHHLKYNHISGVGIDTGRFLGNSLRENPHFDACVSAHDPEDFLIQPVPLHPRKKRTRGYNQSAYIVKGMADVLSFEQARSGMLLRCKYTRTQTGFSLQKRNENMQNAFAVTETEYFQDKVIVLVDDVFTTGSTTFTCASVLLESGAEAVIIATLAQA